MPEKIEDYALLGDLQTAALVGRSGSIDWLCLPRFDSSSCFGALLGSREHGRWLIAPADGGSALARRYRPDTLILESEWQTASGRVRVIDFMPPRDSTPDLIRIVEGLEGRVAMRTELLVRFDYGSLVPWMHRLDPRTLIAIGGPDALSIRTDVALRGEHMSHMAEFTVAAGERVPFVATWFASWQAPPPERDPEQELRETEEYWLDWIADCRYEGQWSEAVHTSLIVLKALTYAPTGGIVAAPTTSLPEHIGGSRNWDYRYCWLRDATFTLVALMNTGFATEARAWRDWLLRTVAGDAASLQILYGVGGERRIPEAELPWLPGYAGSSPVRVGNAASEQFQLDVYGEVMDALAMARGHGLANDDHAWDIQRELMDFLEGAWDRPDEGIWEVRGPRKHFTHSKVLAWVAFDRAVGLAERYDLDGPIARWRGIRDEIHAEVCREGFHKGVGAFTQSYGSRALDASLLFIPLVGFLPATDPRVIGTVDAILAHLVRNGFVDRYATGDGVSVDGQTGQEGSFLPCSFWLVDCLALLGRRDEAAELFERLLGVRNDLGLLSEEYDPVERRLLGNFPQAFSHVGLVNSAYNLSQQEGPLDQRAKPSS